MKINPGLYKVRDRDLISNNRYLTVYYVGDGRKFYQFEGGQGIELNESTFLDHYTLVKSLQRPLDIANVHLNLKWEDSDGDEFEISTSDIQVLRDLFEQFPELARAFGAKKIKQKNIHEEGA